MHTLILLPAIALCLHSSLARLPFTPPTDPSTFTNPCAARLCPVGTECRLQQINCIREPCFPVSVCVPTTGSQGERKIEQPVITDDGIDLSCNIDGSCPAGTFCRRTRFGNKCLGNSEVPNKPGTCPRSPPGLGTTCEVRCEGDFECPGKQKCCKLGCAIRCLDPASSPPIVDKPGTCPRSPPDFVTTCEVRCVGDFECPGKQKCCKLGCAIRCLDPASSPPIVDKPGTCPKSPPGLGTTCEVRCNGDFECPGKQKCCKQGCAIRCLDPASFLSIVDKPGTCPRSPPGLITTCDVRCEGDFECPGKQKCCNWGCSIRCLDPASSPPIVDKPGTCPRSPPDLVTTCDVRCGKDFNCPGKQKCCNWGCSIRCLDPASSPPIVDKPGTCPISPPDLVTTCNVRCGKDFNCPGKQKCCNWGCSIRCVDPASSPPIVDKPGTCPISPPALVTTCDVRCGKDFNCLGKQKCCNWGCSIRCLDPASSPPIVDKPGTCPRSPPDLVTTCEVRCEGDFKCPGKQKCCKQGCAIRCLDPVRSLSFINTDSSISFIKGNSSQSIINTISFPSYDKPGTCPRSPPGLITTCEVRCEGDFECTGNQKCCQRGCAIDCLDPVISSPFIQSDSSPSFIKSESSSSFTKSDSSPPIIKLGITQQNKPGVCPKSPTSLIFICVVRCNGDFECPGKQKCCKQGCAIRCLDPASSPPIVDKPGTCPRSPPDLITTCEVRCNGDFECPGKQKCCKQGCAIRCLDPVSSSPFTKPPSIKPGTCRISFQTLCSSPVCRRDGDCLGNSKCCRTKKCRGRRCVNPKPFFFSRFGRHNNANDDDDDK